MPHKTECSGPGQHEGLSSYLKKQRDRALACRNKGYLVWPAGTKGQPLFAEKRVQVPSQSNRGPCPTGTDGSGPGPQKQRVLALAHRNRAR